MSIFLAAALCWTYGETLKVGYALVDGALLDKTSLRETLATSAVAVSSRRVGTGVQRGLPSSHAGLLDSRLHENKRRALRAHGRTSTWSPDSTSSPGLLSMRLPPSSTEQLTHPTPEEN
ncbi:hypothetical protein [Lolliginicoccus levis]|uniref:hypothetical protein n=1 Tax=Lolliginicoccus levis TaxID=2919542 RepID=UPI00241EC156|nr:hypothetical protein [Lolliginicoccus levis]